MMWYFLLLGNNNNSFLRWCLFSLCYLHWVCEIWSTDDCIISSMQLLLLLLQVASKVIGEVRALIIFPVIPYTILAIFYMFWFSAALNLFSSGQVLENNCDSNCCVHELGLKRVSCDRCCGYSIHYTPHIGAAILFHLFGCYWATQFFKACSSTVIAGSVASYYWTRGETSVSYSFEHIN